MLIGELARRSGLSRDTIRYYEKVGILHVDPRQRRANNYKEYSEAMLTRLLFTRHFKKLGFTLAEIADLLDQFEVSDRPCENLPSTLHEKLTHVDQQIKELLHFRKQILKVLSVCDGTCEEVSPAALCL